MRNDNLNSFLIANKDKIIVHKGKNGKIELESLVPSEELYYYNTNCKVDRVRNKFVLTTKDGERFEITFRPKEEKVTVDNNPPSEEIKIVDEAKERKPKRRSFVSSRKGVLYLQGIKDLILVKKLIKKQKKEEKSLSSQMVSPHGEFDNLKAKSSQLMPKIEEILKNEKYISDPELASLRQRFNLIKERYDYAISKNDNAEMLNVKTKLVNLSGRIIARFNELERQQGVGAPVTPEPPKAEEQPITVEPPKPEGPKASPEPPKAEEQPITVEPPKPEGPKASPEPPKKRTVKKKTTKAKKVPKTTVSAVKDTPKPSKDPLQASITRFKNTYTAKLESFDRQIGLLNEKSNLYSSEIRRLEDNIMNIDQIAKDNNFDSRESKIYIEDQKEKIIEVKSKLDKVEEEKKKIEEQKQTYQNERIDVKVKNEYSDTGYIPMNMTRLEYYNKLRSTEILDERIKLREEIKKDDEEIKNLEELLAKKKAEKAKKEVLDMQMFEVGTKFTQAAYSVKPVEKEKKTVVTPLVTTKNVSASKVRNRKLRTSVTFDIGSFNELEKRGQIITKRIGDLNEKFDDFEERMTSGEIVNEEPKKGLGR